MAKLDRLSRDTRFLLSLLDSGVPVKFLDLPDIGSDPITSRLLLTVMAAFAEFESRRIGQRIREAVARRKERDKRLNISRKRTFGHEHQARAAAGWHARNRRIAAEFAHEYSPLIIGLKSTLGTLAAVAAELNARGIRTRRGRPWTPGLVFAILKKAR